LSSIVSVDRGPIVRVWGHSPSGFGGQSPWSVSRVKVNSKQDICITPYTEHFTSKVVWHGLMRDYTAYLPPTRASTNGMSYACLIPQQESITALWPVHRTHLAEGRGLSWPGKPLKAEAFGTFTFNRMEKFASLWYFVSVMYFASGCPYLP